ncbi:TetR/AcrR family transcriptional regulator [Bacillus mesophilum]|uniref:TetR/AcrR family transcriptional regulator n=1 Tax=Bacillus mesophilum TaxID=1071718 RepID=A0A7V7RHG0_9BACI|nr:TetR/AcrR family transcriptional regulator [Bacillus mesophilum]KAB2328726.1 TetR/AcrR family transcriptional regulator [Bacillus mesophilum]
MMKEWIPIPGTNKDRLITVALEEFSKKGFEGVNITELAEKAQMTTGAVYHHFGSKAKLYEVIRTEIEQRILDRMEGAASLFDNPNEAIKASMITGMDFVTKNEFSRLISEPNPTNKTDRIERFLSDLNNNNDLPLELVLIASWRSILKGISKEEITSKQGKELINWLFKKES